MKKTLWAMLFVCLLLSFLCAALAESGANPWPPTEKQEASGIVINDDYYDTPVEEYLNGAYFIDGERRRISVTPCLVGEDGTKEFPSEIHVTSLSDDEKLRGFIQVQTDSSIGSKLILLDMDAVSQPCTPELRIDMLSEHYWASITARPVILNGDSVHMELLSSDVSAPVGKATRLYDLYTERVFVRTEPEFEYDCFVTDENGEGKVQSGSYELSSPGLFTAKEAGDYKLMLHVRIGINDFTRGLPITVHASEGTYSAEVQGSAPLSRYQQEFFESLYQYIGQTKKADEYVTKTDNAIFVYALEAGKAIIRHVHYLVFSNPVIIPDHLDGYPVREIGPYLFSGQKELRTVILPEGLEVIGDSAFRDCENLSQPSIPSTIKKIGSNAFRGVTFNAPALPEGAADVASDWFSGKEQKDATGKWSYRLLSNNTAAITGYEYEKKLQFPSEVDGIPVTEIHRKDWYNGIENDKAIVIEINIPEGVKIIGQEAFINMNNLRKVYFPESLVEINDLAFDNTRLREIVIPPNVERIGNSAFHLTDPYQPIKITVMNPQVEFGRGIFGYKQGKYNEPETWQSYYSDFPDQSPMPRAKLELVCYQGSTADRLFQYDVKKTYLKWSADHTRTAPAESILKAGLYKPEEFIVELIVPEGVTEIADGALEGLQSLLKVTLPSTLTTIGARAFKGCDELSELTLPKKTVKIGEECFMGCTRLNKINLPNGISEIPDSAFENCPSLSKLSLPSKGLVRIGKAAFSGCTALIAIKLNKGLEVIDERAFEKTGLKSLQIPDTVTKLGTAVFEHSKLTSLTLAKGLTEIPDRMCGACLELKNVKIPAGITRIGNLAFMYCSSLSSLTLPEGLVSIGDNAFTQFAEQVQTYYQASSGKKRFSSLTSLKIPASVERIGNEAFACCDALTGITFARGSKLTHIGHNAFAMCLHLKEIRLPDSLQEIGAYSFVNCLEIKTVDLGKGLKTTGEQLFKFCGKLTSLTVPDALTNIGRLLLDEHGDKLKVTCSHGSAMETYLKKNYPEVAIVYMKK